MSIKIRMREFPALDGMRFVAVTLVVLFHIARHTNPVLRFIQANGSLGVEIFFTISGFIITYMLMKEYETKGKIEIKKFFIRRILRLWPTWLFSLLVTFFYVLYLGQNNPKFIHYLLHLGNYSYTYFGSVHFTMDHYWSLAVEEHFYLFWGLCFMPFVKHLKDKRWMILFMIVVPYLCRVYGYSRKVGAFETQSVFDCLFYGCFLALNWDKIPSLNRRQGYVLLVMALIFGFFACEFLNTNRHGYSIWVYALSYTFISLATSLVIVVCLKEPRNILSRVLSLPFLAKLGILSYGVYVYHMLVIDVLFRNFMMKKEVIGLNELMVYVMLLTYAAAWLGYLLIEKRFDEVRKRFK